MTLAMQIDLVVAVLLLVAIGAMAVLNRRLSALRRDRSELERLTHCFGEATGRADEGISSLKSVAASLDQAISEARGLRDDLDFLLERGGKLADRLEGEVRKARPVDAARGADTAPVQAASRPAPARTAARPAASGSGATRPGTAGSAAIAPSASRPGSARQPARQPARSGDDQAALRGSHLQPLSAAERHLVSVLQGRD